ncbi:UDP-glucuronosyltransferase 2B17 [Dissostichus eleginoides]|uniref:UDP-glucuronosyltransferase 2B17 n=1 Tax=Dissostichus eleginoides TaxID=100907 RepID=A0AAD9CCI4_DISEL|nr:UDP-glucuronosyltransferase 2B17 [Dissostichus eleginoides]
MMGENQKVVAQLVVSIFENKTLIKELQETGYDMFLTDPAFPGHPKTKVFVTHGGTNGIYEAIYHGVPVLGIPLIFDQYDNMTKKSTSKSKNE